MPNNIPPFFLGIDVGTSGIRCCVIDQQKQPITLEAVSFHPGKQYNPQHWWERLQTLLQRLKNKNLTHNIIAVSIDATSGTLLALDKTNKCLGKAIMYFENPAPASNPCYSPGLQKALYLKQQHPQLERIVHQADWIIGKMTGQYQFSDYHNALKSGYDIDKMCWSKQTLEHFSQQQLAEVYPPGTPLCALSDPVKTHYHFQLDCKIVAGTTDANAAFLASGATKPGEAMTSLGTTLVLKILSPIRIEKKEFGVYSHKIGDLWLVSGASNCGTGVLKKYFTDEEIQQMSRELKPDKPTGLSYYPLIGKGERFPENNPEKIACLSPKPPRKQHFFQAILEGISDVESKGYQCLQQLGAPEVTKIFTTGGGCKNKLWQQIRQNKLQIPVQQAEHSEACFGAALLAYNRYN